MNEGFTADLFHVQLRICVILFLVKSIKLSKLQNAPLELLKCIQSEQSSRELCCAHSNLLHRLDTFIQHDIFIVSMCKTMVACTFGHTSF